MEAAKPSSGFSEEGPQISRGTLRPNMALTYRDARSAWWSECRWDRNTCTDTIQIQRNLTGCNCALHIGDARTLESTFCNAGGDILSGCSHPAICGDNTSTWQEYSFHPPCQWRTDRWQAGSGRNRCPCQRETCPHCRPQSGSWKQPAHTSIVSKAPLIPKIPSFDMQQHIPWPSSEPTSVCT